MATQCRLSVWVPISQPTAVLRGVFSELPDPVEYPDYRERTRKPMSWTLLRARVTNTRMSPKAFRKEAVRVLDNAVKYFGYDSEQGEAAERLREDVEQVLRDFDDQLRKAERGVRKKMAALEKQAVGYGRVCS